MKKLSISERNLDQFQHNFKIVSANFVHFWTEKGKKMQSHCGGFCFHSVIFSLNTLCFFVGIKRIKCKQKIAQKCYRCNSKIEASGGDEETNNENDSLVDKNNHHG